MADLLSDTGSLRLRLDPVTREAALRGPGLLPASDGRPASGRLLMTVALDYLDRRDGERWPLVHLPVVYVAGESARALADAFLSDTAGTPRRPGAELALFRFPVAVAALVAFAAALRSEVEARLAT
jgi:hypothetical protein